EQLWSGAVPMGKPINNTQLFVLGANLELLPTCVTGELYIHGEGIGIGYLNNPGLTAERFIPNSFSSEPGTRLYKTGDIVRYGTGGHLEFLGRIDDQVKLRGFRIELGEIEAALMEHESVSRAAVVGKGEEADKRLVAYVVASGSVSREALKSHLLC